MMAKAKWTRAGAVITVCAGTLALGAGCGAGTSADSVGEARSDKSSHGPNAYEVNRLVSDDTTAVPARYQDPLLKNAWGLAAGPTTFWWVADNETGASTLYDGEGVKQSLEVTVPGNPTGVVFNGGSAFLVSDGTHSGAARFIFASEDGTISGWSPGVPPPPPSHSAFVMVPASSAGEVYKGLAIATTTHGDRLYATDFHNARIRVFNDTWKDVTLSAGAFTDPDLPTGYAPFGIRAFDGMIVVTYALQDSDAHDDVSGQGHGYIDAYDLDGTLMYRVASGARLNSPWGLAMAPDDFGKFSNMLLVGNFGDGHINAFDLTNCHRRGCVDRGELHEPSGGAIVIEGLWALDFGKGNSSTGDTDELYFTAGPDHESHGLFGYIEPSGHGHHSGG